MTQRDRLAAVLVDRYARGHLAFPCGEDTEVEADALIARGVRVVDVKTLARALDIATEYKPDAVLSRVEGRYWTRDRVAAAILAALDERAPQEAER